MTTYWLHCASRVAGHIWSTVSHTTCSSIVHSYLVWKPFPLLDHWSSALSINSSY